MSRRDRFLSLRTSAPQILPSLLLCDFGHLAQEVRDLEATGVGGLHLDVMDGHFVPNFTYGLPIVEALHRLASVPLDVHLMMLEPERYVERFYEAGAAAISFHAEAVRDPLPILRQITRCGAAAGLALNPDTPLAAVDNCLSACDFALIMSVPAGFGGQPFQEGALDKLRQLRQASGPELLLEIDGGVNRQTIRRCAAAGAQLFVAGSAIFRSSDYKQAVAQLQHEAAA